MPLSKYKSIEHIFDLIKSHNHTDILDLQFKQVKQQFRYIFVRNNELDLIDPSNTKRYENHQLAWNNRKTRHSQRQQQQQQQQQQTSFHLPNLSSADRDQFIKIISSPMAPMTPDRKAQSLRR